MSGHMSDDGMPPVENIGAEQARELIANGAMAVDVREQWEWNAGHIPEAHLIPLGGIYQFGQAAAQLPNDTDVIFVCESGQRSMVASEIALVAGLKPGRVYNLAGGMAGWRRAGLSVEK